MKNAFLLATLISCFNLLGQETLPEKEAFKHHRITIAFGHTHVQRGLENSDQKWLILGSWGLDYDYWFNEKWALGFHNDIVLQNFAVERINQDGPDGVLKRSYPLASSIVIAYKPLKHLALVAGGGAEFSKEETLALIRAGIEYGWDLPNHWELSISVMNDFKIDVYDSWMLALGVGKRF